MCPTRMPHDALVDAHAVGGREQADYRRPRAHANDEFNAATCSSQLDGQPRAGSGRRLSRDLTTTAGAQEIDENGGTRTRTVPRRGGARMGPIAERRLARVGNIARRWGKTRTGRDGVGAVGRPSTARHQACYGWAAPPSRCGMRQRVESRANVPEPAGDRRYDLPDYAGAHSDQSRAAEALTRTEYEDAGPLDREQRIAITARGAVEGEPRGGAASRRRTAAPRLGEWTRLTRRVGAAWSPTASGQSPQDEDAQAISL